jgi:hypothetical protein
MIRKQYRIRNYNSTDMYIYKNKKIDEFLTV